MTRAVINLSNLKNNYRIVRRITTASAAVICVVKADAYGHGVKPCAEALHEAGARFFAVANAEEALELRHILPDVEILILGYTPHEMFDTLIENNIIQTIYNFEHINPKLRVHIKVDTGMNRLGVGWDAESPLSNANIVGADIPPLTREGKNHYLFSFSPLLKGDTAKPRGILIEGVYTHFACAEEPSNPMTLQQFERFTSFVERNGLQNVIRHAANSAAIINFPQTHLDAVRAGIILYGLYDFEGIKPVMTLKTIVSHVHTVKKGETIGYGAAFTAPRDMKIVTLPIGYADGFIRAYNKGFVTFNGKPLPIVGRICMDQCMADASEINENIKIGDEIFIFGENALCRADDFAEWASSINYETVCLISKRVPRVYKCV
ncbi:MAG: alanine racemase [Oscillospiraceae bacterium]|nr:alanine racemase [Oscillospiraceae bacterium]